jgi:hypothetical protein
LFTAQVSSVQVTPRPLPAQDSLAGQPPLFVEQVMRVQAPAT